MLFMKKKNVWNMIILIAASGTAELFWTGKWAFLLAPWLLPVFLLRFFRTAEE